MEACPAACEHVLSPRADIANPERAPHNDGTPLFSFPLLPERLLCRAKSTTAQERAARRGAQSERAVECRPELECNVFVGPR